MGKKHTFILCDGSRVNTMGFRIDIDGIDTGRFAANPVMLYSHDSTDVIGRWDNLRIENGKLVADAVFDTEDEQGKRIAGKVERGFLKGCSMGLYIKELHEVEGVPVATRSELMEASVCPIPSDAGAIRLYDQNHKELTFEEVRLQFNNQLKPIEMAEKNDKTEMTPAADPKDAEIANLKAQLAESKKREVDSFLTAAVQSGKITNEEKEGFAKLAAGDFETVKAIIETRPAKASTTLKELKAQAAATPAGRESWTYLEWMKRDPAGLKRMKTENPSEFERLQATLKKQ